MEKNIKTTTWGSVNRENHYALFGENGGGDFNMTLNTIIRKICTCKGDTIFDKYT